MLSAKQAAKSGCISLTSQRDFCSRSVGGIFGQWYGVFLCFQLLSSIPGWNNLGRADPNNTDGLSSWWPMVEEATVG